MSEKQLPLATVNRLPSTYRGYWRYLQDKEAASEDLQPFAVNLSGALVSNSGSAGSSKRPYSAKEAATLLAAVRVNGDTKLVNRSSWACTLGRFVIADLLSVKNSRHPNRSLLIIDHCNVGTVQLALNLCCFGETVLGCHTGSMAVASDAKGKFAVSSGNCLMTREQNSAGTALNKKATAAM